MNRNVHKLSLTARQLTLVEEWATRYFNGSRAFSCGLVVKNLPANAGDVARAAGSAPGSGRSPGGGNDNPLQYSCLEIPWTEEPGGLQSVGLQKDEDTTL